MNRNTDNYDVQQKSAAEARSTGGHSNMSTSGRSSRSIEESDLDEHFDNTPLWQFAVTNQQRSSLLVPVYAMLLFCISGLSLCYQATA